MVVASCLTMTPVMPHPDWSLVAEPLLVLISVDYLISCGLLFSWMRLRRLIYDYESWVWLGFACWPFSVVLSQSLWQECPLDWLRCQNWFGYLSHSFSSWFAWAVSAGIDNLHCYTNLWYWLHCLTHPRLALSQSAACWSFVSFMASWGRLWGFLVALRYALTCLAFIIGNRRSSMNLVVSLSVSDSGCVLDHS